MRGEKLHRNDVGDGGVQVLNAGLELRGKLDQTRGLGSRRGIAFVGDDQGFSFQLAKTIEHRGNGRPSDAAGCENEDGKGALHQCDGAMHQVGGGESFRDHIAGFHELEAKLQGVGVIQASADSDCAGHKKIALGQVLDIFFQAQGRIRPLGHATQVIELHVSGKRIGEEINHHQLAGVGFRGGDAFFASRLDQQRIFH